ncbi:MAG TPA: hypothetical protein VIT90_04195 [Lysobacter sp.]
MSHPFDEPLTPEERAMADRLARLGPHDGPSPSLDAKILAAAHAAVAPRKNRRWLAVSGVPATLVTGAGMAAVLALAVGVVWQMRPSAPAPQAPRGEADDFGFVTAEVIERAESRHAPPPPPPPSAEAPAPAPAHVLQSPAMARREAAAPGGNAAMAAKGQAPVMQSQPEHYLDEAVDPAHAHGAAAVATAAAAMRSDSAPPPASPAPASAPAPAAVAAESEYRERAAAEAESAQRKSVAKEVDERRQLRAEGYTTAMPAAAPVAADAVATDTADSTTLDRIEVSGSRIRAADLPVRSDRDLEPAQWLQRIRERRDSGDLDGARESLALFRKAYPRVHLPDDLRTLPASPR